MSLLGKPAPDFTLPSDDGGSFTLSKNLGKTIVLVFYPGDDTAVCTAQLCEYRDGIEAFKGLDAGVVGISGNSLESHKKFKEKYGLPFPLLADVDGTVRKLYSSHNFMGGSKRSVFIIDKKGLVQYEHIEVTSLFRRKKDELVEALTKIQ